jgi:glutamine amidotransferase
MNKHVVVVDYGSGNVRSVVKALERVAPTGTRITLSGDPKVVEDATHIVLPGVGAFGDCMAGLESLPSMLDVLKEQVHVKKKPFLGICVGMQLLADEGLEHGRTKGLGWIKGRVVAIAPKKKNLKIPHMGWNELILKRSHPIVDGIDLGAHMYFVHSYHFECEEKECILAEVGYGSPLVAILVKENVIATQFHPEKSQKAGLRLLENFMRMTS